MKPGQFKPFTYKIKKTPLIIYPVKDENPLSEIFNPKDHNSIQQHLNKLYQKHSKLLNKGDYHILFVWNLQGNRMTDMWIHNMKNWSDSSGPLMECITFRNLEVCDDAGIASGDSIIALGREEELRRQINNIREYVDRKKHIPEFPSGMTPSKSFYKT